jgi:dolichyl-phosphate beta-glucosyltransferase
MLTVVIPVKNDPRLISTIEIITNHLDIYSSQYEIIISGKFKIEGAYGNNIDFIYLDNPDKGLCIKEAVKKAKGEYILIIDADFPISINNFDNMLNRIGEKYDAIFFNRFLKESSYAIGSSKFRIYLSWLFHVIVSFVFAIGKYDTQCGVKCFKNSVAKKIYNNILIDGLSSDVDVILLFRKYQFVDKELPVKYSYSKSTLILRRVIPIMVFELANLFVKRKLRIT